MDVIDTLTQQWSTEKPHLDTGPMAMMGRLLRIAKQIEASLAQLHKQYDLKLGEFDVLATLRRSGAPYRLTPSELINAMLLTSGAMTNRLDKLTSKGLIVRIHSEQDRRSVAVELTERGRTVIDALLEEHVALQHRLVEELNVSQREALTALLKEWQQQLES